MRIRVRKNITIDKRVYYAVMKEAKEVNMSTSRLIETVLKKEIETKGIKALLYCDSCEVEPYSDDEIKAAKMAGKRLMKKKVA